MKRKKGRMCNILRSAEVSSGYTKSQEKETLYQVNDEDVPSIWES